jgi:hypothetical protein
MICRWAALDYYMFGLLVKNWQAVQSILPRRGSRFTRDCGARSRCLSGWTDVAVVTRGLHRLSINVYAALCACSQVLHVVMYPRYAVDLPIFAMDLVMAKGYVTGCENERGIMDVYTVITRLRLCVGWV